MLINGGERPAPVETSPAPEHTVTGPLQNRGRALLVVTDASSRVQLTLANIPGLLYRITTPAGSGLTPRVTSSGGVVRAALLPTGADGPDEVRIVLNRGVRWDIRLPAGAGEQRLDLTRGRVTRLEVGASGLVELRLPRPVGTVPLTLTGGVGRLAVSAPRSVPIRLNRPSPARNRYVLRACAPVGILAVHRTDGPG